MTGKDAFLARRPHGVALEPPLAVDALERAAEGIRPAWAEVLEARQDEEPDPGAAAIPSTPPGRGAAAALPQGAYAPVTASDPTEIDFSRSSRAGLFAWSRVSWARLVWAGAALLSGGILALLLARATAPAPPPVEYTARAREPAPAAAPSRPATRSAEAPAERAPPAVPAAEAPAEHAPAEQAVAPEQAEPTVAPEHARREPRAAPAATSAADASADRPPPERARAVRSAKARVARPARAATLKQAKRKPSAAQRPRAGAGRAALPRPGPGALSDNPY